MSVSKTLRYQVFRRDNHTCHYCGRAAPEVKLTIDHVVPEALGGRDVPENLRTACEDCNGGKSAMPADADQVAAVAADADRWARARQAAADRMLADLEARKSSQAAFLQKWKSVSAGAKPIPMPSSWPQDVDRLLAAGLPLSLLLDSIDVAMGARHIGADAAYKYMCGVAWNRIRKIDEAAVASSAEPIAVTDPAPFTVAQFIHSYIGEDDADPRLLELLKDELDQYGTADAVYVLHAFIDDLVDRKREQ